MRQSIYIPSSPPPSIRQAIAHTALQAAAAAVVLITLVILVADFHALEWLR